MQRGERGSREKESVQGTVQDIIRILFYDTEIERQRKLGLFALEEGLDELAEFLQKGTSTHGEVHSFLAEKAKFDALVLVDPPLKQALSYQQLIDIADYVEKKANLALGAIDYLSKLIVTFRENKDHIHANILAYGPPRIMPDVLVPPSAPCGVEAIGHAARSVLSLAGSLRKHAGEILEKEKSSS
jgi:hypothetical protein